MLQVVFFAVVTLISFGFFFAVVYEIRRHNEMYQLPRSMAMNCKHAFFQKRFVITLYLGLLLVFSTFATIVTFYQFFE